MSEALHQLWYPIRHLPKLLALRLEQLNLSLHAPDEVLPGEFVCLRCQVHAPCRPYMDAAERAAKLRARASSPMRARIMRRRTLWMAGSRWAPSSVLLYVVAILWSLLIVECVRWLIVAPNMPPWAL